MKISLGFSSCPNDTFIFDAMIHHKVDTEGLEFDVTIADVEKLNQLAFAKTLHVTKLSFYAFAKILGHYQLLTSGAALGRNCGPLLISKRAMSASEINSCRIAIPGEHTTANFLFQLAYPAASKRVPFQISEIEPAILQGDVEAGVIIHENRFTYQAKGLTKLVDLGEVWESKTHLPIPLGGIAVQSDLQADIKLALGRVMKRSVAFAFEHPESSSAFVKMHAQEMDEQVMRQHITLYVNDFTLELGTVGKEAVLKFLELAGQSRISKKNNSAVFSI